MLSVFDAVQQHQKTAVLPVALIGISGQHPENRDKHQHIRKNAQYQIQNGQSVQEQAGYTAEHAEAQEPHIQFIAAVTAGHKALQALRKSAGSSGIHDITLLIRVIFIILHFSGISTIVAQCSRIVNGRSRWLRPFRVSKNPQIVKTRNKKSLLLEEKVAERQRGRMWCRVRQHP